MKQLIQDVAVQYNNSLDLTPLQDSLIFKYVFNNITNFNSGSNTFTIGDTTNYQKATDINYLFLTSTKKFQVIFEDAFLQEQTLETQQFSYVNLEISKTFTFRQSQAADEEITINYLSGTCQDA